MSWAADALDLVDVRTLRPLPRGALPPPLPRPLPLPPPPDPLLTALAELKRACDSCTSSADEPSVATATELCASARTVVVVVVVVVVVFVVGAAAAPLLLPRLLLLLL